MSVAFAADMSPGPAPVPPPVYIPPPAPPPFGWSGIYFGANGGFGFASGTATASAATLFGGATATASENFSGAIAGGQIGFNWQINSVVFGIEADGYWSEQNSTTNTVSCFGLCTLSEKTGINWFATARAHVGYAFDRILVYGTGGAA